MKLGVKFWGGCFEVLCKLLIPVYVGFTFVNCFFPEVLLGEKVMQAMDSLYGFNPSMFTFGQRCLMFLMNTVSCFFAVYGLLLGIKIARLFGRGEAFTMPSALLFARLRAITFIWAIYGILIQYVFFVVFMPKMPTNIFLVNFGFVGLFYLFVVVLFSALTALVTRGANLQKDQDLTV